MDTRLALVSPAQFRLFGYISTVACQVACSVIHPARMSLPEAFSARASSYQVQGINVGTRGDFYLNDLPGSYYRSASRLEVFDVHDGRSSTLSFNFDGTLADCSAKERQLNFRELNFSPKPMAYACDMEQTDGARAGRLELQEAREPPAGAFAQRQRLGVFHYDQCLLKIRSVHAVQGSTLEVNLPIGYTFEVDGRLIGAVEINGGVTLFLDDSAPADVKQAAALVALALGLLWDTGGYDT